MKKYLIVLITYYLCACGGGEIKKIPKHLSTGVEDMINGNELYLKGCYKKALEDYFESFRNLSLSDQIPEAAKVLNNIGNVYRITGKTEDAILFYNEAKKLYKSVNDLRGILLTEANISASLISEKRFDEAESLLLETHNKMKAQKLSETSVIKNLAVLYTKKGDYKKAIEYLSEIEATKSQGKSLSSGFYFAKGNYLYLTGKYEEAIKNYKRALSMDRQSGFFEAIAQDLYELGRSYRKKGDSEKAVLFLKRSMRVYSILGNNKKASKIMREAGLEEDLLEKFFVEKWLKMEESPCD